MATARAVRPSTLVAFDGARNVHRARELLRRKLRIERQREFVVHRNQPEETLGRAHLPLPNVYTGGAACMKPASPFMVRFATERHRARDTIHGEPAMKMDALPIVSRQRVDAEHDFRARRPPEEALDLTRRDFGLDLQRCYRHADRPAKRSQIAAEHGDGACDFVASAIDRLEERSALEGHPRCRTVQNVRDLRSRERRELQRSCDEESTCGESHTVRWTTQLRTGHCRGETHLVIAHQMCCVSPVKRS